ncbi:hypothetical protein EMIHUDRAFT_227342 [Emiliania huxleyi CCMP1516]|uniref:Uncharacterized protein n=2 Tax=Emiliania huxleyi TaxID=2903 RepID=A0A0D3KJ50_EMIH1|nr:hypothetical protein EMIHUDRAFT_227342 [Emiliania huxleyi CCMP1516]EOD35785.1 hypothetical protein EMIHUDRAFT_227342 [Emiliania huxleyi CCMP1516]|eukprot:XP_005788214.1 hypothetical protein EMIHUDRAFT_227342 [Emiliania huxleyi CCMP1516]
MNNGVTGSIYERITLRSSRPFADWTAVRCAVALSSTLSCFVVAYSLPPEGGSGFGDLVYATVPLGSVATKGDRKVADLITAAGASAPADAVFGGGFATGETPRPTTSASEADKGDGVGGDGGNGVTCDLFEPDPTPMEDL